MSLDYNLTKIKDRETVCWYKDADGQTQMSVVTEMIIFGTMFVGIREITEANAEVFTCRLADWWAEEGPIGEWKEGEDKPVYRQVTLDEVRAHIGLRTNATNYTPRQWKTALTLRRTVEANDRLRAAERAKKGKA